MKKQPSGLHRTTALPALALLLAASGAAQAKSSFDLAAQKGGGNAAEYAWDGGGRVLTVKDGAEITITGSVKGGTRIEVAARATATITLDDVSLSIPQLGGGTKQVIRKEKLGFRIAGHPMGAPPWANHHQSPLQINAGANVTLIIKGINTLTAGRCTPAGYDDFHCAGIEVLTGTTLSIEGTGALTAIGGQNGAGIGGGDFGSNRDAGAITIKSGTVTAYGGYGGAGIGGGNSGMGTIIISGGTVTAEGGAYGNGAGIGGGSGGKGGNITITGDANITATGGDSPGIPGYDDSYGGGAGIGSGGGGGGMSGLYPAGTIKIDTTGTLSATGGSNIGGTFRGANIGRGNYGWRDDGAGIKSLSSPASVSVTAGSTASFICDVTAMAGAPAPAFAWSWQFSSGAATPPQWTPVSGAASATLNLPSVTQKMAGQYRCVVTVSGLANDLDPSSNLYSIVKQEYARAGLTREPISSILYASRPATLTVTAGP